MLLLLIGALVLAPLLSTQVAPAAQDGAIHVAVRAAGTSAPIAGAKVTARQMPDPSSAPANRKSGLFTGSATTDEAARSLMRRLQPIAFAIMAASRIWVPGRTRNQTLLEHIVFNLSAPVNST